MSECNIVKDLMPLCIDGVASEDSRKLVTDHVGKCEKCAAVYADCQRELPVQEPHMNYSEAAKALQKWHRVRKMLLIGLTVIATVFVLFAAYYGWDVLTTRPLVTLALDEYDVRLVRMQDGQVKMIVLTDEPGLKVDLSGHGTGGDMEFTVRRSIIRRSTGKATIRWAGSWQDGEFWADDDPGVGHVHQAVSFTDGVNSRVIYTAGDDIPLASPEMEVLDALSRSFYAGGKGNGLTDEQQAAYDAQYALVPEFQPE